MNEQIDLATAQRVIDTALEVAGAQGALVATVVVDRGGHIVAAARMDGISFVMTDVARRKATLASAMALPTGSVADMAGADPLLLGAFTGSPDVLALGGGAPIMGSNGPIGGLGIAGGHYTSDQAIADKAVQ